jgi:hypothetical protein
MLPWDLEDWLTEAGHKIVVKAADAGSRDVLDLRERLLYEVWLFDTEQRNGGVSQYFANRGRAHWEVFSRLASPRLPSFAEFAAKIDKVVGDSEDPYSAIIESDTDLDQWYEQYCVRLVTELRSAVPEELRIAKPPRRRKR